MSWNVRSKEYFDIKIYENAIKKAFKDYDIEFYYHMGIKPTLYEDNPPISKTFWREIYKYGIDFDIKIGNRYDSYLLNLDDISIILVRSNYYALREDFEKMIELTKTQIFDMILKNIH